MAKVLIYFNAPDKPENMGQSQLTADISQFLAERANVLVDATIDGDRIHFTKDYDIVLDAEGNEVSRTPVRGFAIITTVPDDFQN